jgi:hypothetical protein
MLRRSLNSLETSSLTNIKGLEKERSKPKHILRIEHGNIPIQLDLWGNGVIFKGKGQTTLYGYITA